MIARDLLSTGPLRAGAATADITPAGSVFLFGYPRVRRYSTGVHDPLDCAALYLGNGASQVLFLANDLIFVTKAITADVRRRIHAQTGVPEDNIVVTATHTHSGPVVVDYLSNQADPAVPKADPEYLAWVAGQMVRAATDAVRSAVSAEIGIGLARAVGTGSNRHDPSGPADPDVPVLLARAREGGAPIGCLVVHAMHPTVLHEDSTLISADFPGFARRFLREGALPPTCPILHLNGASGDQSPRHAARANTFAEARRLGEILGRSIADVLPRLVFLQQAAIGCAQAAFDPRLRSFGGVADAVAAARRAADRLEHLKAEGAPRHLIRGAECDEFGAEETVTLARAAAEGRLADAARACTPLEIQVVQIGTWFFAAWPGEFFVEYALALRAAEPSAYAVTMANGELQGYIATPEAAAAGRYEATNALFCPSNGPPVVELTRRLIGALRLAGGPG